MTFTIALPQEVLHVHLSMGFAVSDGHDPTTLVAAADDAMYIDKRG